MVKKLFYKNGIFVIQDKQLTMKQCYFIVNNYPQNDYLLKYYESIGFVY